MEITEVYEPNETDPVDVIDGTWFDPEDGPVMIDPFGLPFESMDEFSDAPLEFEELAETLWKILNDTYILSVQYNRHSPYYPKLCSHLEKDIKQLGSLCVTKAVLEQKDLSFPKLEGLTVKELYAMVSLHFRKCRQAFQDGLDADKGYDMEMLDWVCRWALLAERLKATEEKIQKIRSGKISADQLLERAQAFKNEPRGNRPQRSPQEIRKAASLPVINSFASDMIQRNRQVERQRIREERAREKAKKKAAQGGLGGAKPFPPLPITPEAFRELFPVEAESGEDTEARLKIPKKNLSAVSSRNGPSNDVRKKLREKRKKKR